MDPLFQELEIAMDEPWFERARQLNGESSRTLEGISTVLYLKERQWEGESLRNRFAAIKPHLVESLPEYLEKAETYRAEVATRA